MARSAGVLLSITSLPSPYGIGTIGKEARKFADFLKKQLNDFFNTTQTPVCVVLFCDYFRYN